MAVRRLIVAMLKPGILYYRHVALAFALSLLGSSARAQQQPAAGSRYDVTNYRIEAQLNPDEHTLRACADVAFVPLEATRSVVFEVNASLHVDSFENDGKTRTVFVQDAVGAGTLS